MCNWDKHRWLDCLVQQRDGLSGPCCCFLWLKAFLKTALFVRVPRLPVHELLPTVQEPPAFSWSKQWYPVALLNDLDPRRPMVATLLGQDFVLWRDKNKNWRCFEDRCPHRLAPLSEGRIEPQDHSLMCSYHVRILSCDLIRNCAYRTTRATVQMVMALP